MKNCLIGFVAAFILVFMCSFAWQPSYGGNSSAAEVVMKNIEGHKYVIVTGTSGHWYGGCSVAIVHAESCSCKNKR